MVIKQRWMNLDCRITTKAPLNHNGSEVFLYLWVLFLYRDFLSVFEGKDHLVIIDREAGEESADIAFVEGDQCSGKALKEGRGIDVFSLHSN